MDELTSRFVRRAREGAPVYITDVREGYARLPPEDSFRLTCVAADIYGSKRAYEIAMPLFHNAPISMQEFVTEFFLAELYNILSTLGGTSLDFYTIDNSKETEILLRAFSREFCLPLPRRERHGYGRCINVLERILSAVHHDTLPETHHLRWSLNTDCSPRIPAATDRDCADGQQNSAAPADGILTVCREAVAGLEGKAFCGIDVGGSDIKTVLAIDEKIVCLKEYNWFPASFTRIDQLLEPILSLVRLMRLCAISEKTRSRGELMAILEPALKNDAADGCIVEAVRRGEKLMEGVDFAFDAIGLSFPDVVVRDRIVGGEVYKTRGIRQNQHIDYEQEFAKLTRLDQTLKSFVRPGGVVGIINDGHMAAFCAALEIAPADPNLVRNGIFAHTLGTELGTGWVTASGTIPDIPLEVYNYIIDLGSYPERAHAPDDAMSVNNFNTSLPGTLQKYTSQSGVFRLALKYLPVARPDLFQQILDEGFVVKKERNGDRGYYVPTEPKDMRKPFLDFLMGLSERAKDPIVDRIFEELGEFLAITWRETEWILHPTAKERILFGRIVKHPRCFDLMNSGAKRVQPDIRLILAGDELANTPLMRALRARSDYTVAQFAQAIGAVYFGNYRLKLTAVNKRQPYEHQQMS